MTNRQQRRELISHLVAYAELFAVLQENGGELERYRAREIRRIVRRLEDLDQCKYGSRMEVDG